MRVSFEDLNGNNVTVESDAVEALFPDCDGTVTALQIRSEGEWREMTVKGTLDEVSARLTYPPEFLDRWV